MTIKLLYDALMSSDLQEKLTGELTLHNKYIVWTYDLLKHSDDLEDDIDEYCDEVDPDVDYIDMMSNEEKLTDVYDEDIELIQDYIYMINDCIDRTYSDPVVTDWAITFKFF